MCMASKSKRNRAVFQCFPSQQLDILNLDPNIIQFQIQIQLIINITSSTNQEDEEDEEDIKSKRRKIIEKSPRLPSRRSTTNKYNHNHNHKYEIITPKIPSSWPSFENHQHQHQQQAKENKKNRRRQAAF